MSTSVVTFVAAILVLATPCFSFGFSPPRSSLITSTVTDAVVIRSALSGDHVEVDESPKRNPCLRREILLSSAPFAMMLACWAPACAATAQLDVEKARRQLDAVPKLIDEQKWDSVRAILITPPLSECWTKNANMLRLYAESVDDELAALEAREEAVTHLRFLDMAVYNNVFNPIATEGTSGATKELVRSYYEDPINEWKASAAALDELIQLGK